MFQRIHGAGLGDRVHSSFTDRQPRPAIRIYQPAQLLERRQPPKHRGPEWLNDITSIFGYDESIPLPSCFGVAMKSSWNHLNPLSPDVSGTGEAVGAYYALSKYNQAIQYAASTRSRTFGTSFLRYPFKSSTFRSLLKQSGKGASVGLLTMSDVSLFEGLLDEIDAMKHGACQ